MSKLGINEHARIKQLDTSRIKTSPRSKITESKLTGENLALSANALEFEQQVMVEAASVEQGYQETLAMYVQAKHDQVESIEDRLESLINRQQARLQQTQSSKPGFLAMPGTRKTWQISQSKQQGRLQTLHARLETVREIKEGMGLHSPRVVELATRKMRSENPELAADWDSMRQAARHHQALTKKKEQEKKRTQEKSKNLYLGLNQSHE